MTKSKKSSGDERINLQQEIEDLKALDDEREIANLLHTSILDSIQHPIFAIDAEYNYLIFNQVHFDTMKAIYNIDIEQGKSILEYMIVSEDRENAKSNFDRALAGETVVVREFAGDAKIDRRYYEITHAPLNVPSEGTGVIVLVQDITNLESANLRFKKFFQAVEYSPVSIVVTDRDGALEYVNPKFCELTGYTFEQSIGENPRILQSEFTEKGTYKQMWDTILAGKEWRGEFINRKKNGELYYESASISAILDEQDKISHFVAIKEDITGRKMIEEELKKKQASLTALIENTTDDIWSVDSSYRITTINLNFQRNFQTAFNVSLQVGDNIVEALDEIAPDLKTQWQARYDRALGGEQFSEVDHFDIEGVPNYVEAAFNPIYLDGEIVEVSVFSRDITKRKLFEEQLRESEESFRMIAENTADLIWIYNLELNRFSYISPSAPNLRGSSSAESLSDSFESMLTTEPNQYFLDEMPKRVAAFKAGDQGSYYKTDYLDQKREDGSIVHVEVVTTLLVDDDGEVSSILGVSRDISQRKQAEEALRKANQELKIHVQKVEALQEKLREQAIRDSLTGLYNFHYMQEVLEREVIHYKRKKKSIGLILVDIDNFKAVNDTYGHNAGNLMLRKLAEVIRENIRADDIPCRFGGDEILIVMSETTTQVVLDRADLICKKFKALKIPFKDQEMSATLSAGVFVASPKGHTRDQLLNFVDQALYQAKKEGRNRVITYKGEL